MIAERAYRARWLGRIREAAHPRVVLDLGPIAAWFHRSHDSSHLGYHRAMTPAYEARERTQQGSFTGGTSAPLKHCFILIFRRSTMPPGLWNLGPIAGSIGPIGGQCWAYGAPQGQYGRSDYDRISGRFWR